MSDQLQPDPLASAAQLIGGAGIGAVLLKVVERMFARADKGDDVAAGLRGEMVRRLETLEKQMGELEAKERSSFQLAIRLEAENRQLRRRYHALLNWIQAEPSLPQPPAWLYEPVEGPTADEGRPSP
ncbi:MAG: hypothetical protein AB7P40_00350 [Chloroflexota bacterium]